MPSEQDTAPSGNGTEQVNGSQAGEQTAATETTQEQVPSPEQSRLTELEKELNKARQRANQLENQQKEAERKRLEEENRYKELYEQELAEKEKREAADAERERMNEAKSIRDSVINSYGNEKVREAAKKLLSRNDSLFYWGDGVATEEDAKAQVKVQLDALAETFGLNEEAESASQQDVTIDANNPLAGRVELGTDEELEAEKKRLANVKF